VRPEDYVNKKIPIKPSGIEPATFRLVAQCLNQLRYRVSPYSGYLRHSNVRERDHLGDPGVDGRIILRWIFRKWDGVPDWVKLAQDGDKWRAMNLRFPQNEGNFSTS